MKPGDEVGPGSKIIIIIIIIIIIWYYFEGKCNMIIFYVFLYVPPPNNIHKYFVHEYTQIFVIDCAIMGVCLRVYESLREWGLGSSVLHSVQRVAADSGRLRTHVDFTSVPAEGWVGETAQRPTPNLLKVIQLEKGYGLMLNWGERPFFWAWTRKGHLVKAAKWWSIYSFW